MHEMSLVRSLLAQVAQLAADHGAGGVRQIALQVGPLSGIEPALVASAFELLRGEAGMQATQLTIEEVPLEARCQACQTVFQVVRFRFSCPACGSGETDILRGDCVALDTVLLESVDLQSTAQGTLA